MATDQIASIEPGSVPYGDRQTLEAGLAELAGGAAPGPMGGPMAPPGAAPQGDDMLDPEGILASETISDLPITSGLTVGPGEGPFQGIAATTEQQRLQELAINANSPLIRYMAMVALRQLRHRQKMGL